jgi:hypothetical protein
MKSWNVKCVLCVVKKHPHRITFLTAADFVNNISIILYIVRTMGCRWSHWEGSGLFCVICVWIFFNKSPFQAIIIIMHLWPGVSESTLWMPLHHKWILCLCLSGQRPWEVKHTLLGGTRNQPIVRRMLRNSFPICSTEFIITWSAELFISPKVCMTWVCILSNDCIFKELCFVLLQVKEGDSHWHGISFWNVHEWK